MRVKLNDAIDWKGMDCFLCWDTDYVMGVRGNRVIEVDFYGLEGKDNVITAVENHFDIDLSWFKLFNLERPAPNQKMEDIRYHGGYHWEARYYNTRVWSPDGEYWYYFWQTELNSSTEYNSDIIIENIDGRIYETYRVTPKTIMRRRIL
jgi:hypothetical protein